VALELPLLRPFVLRDEGGWEAPMVFLSPIDRY
jgi:hypothetical protein